MGGSPYQMFFIFWKGARFQGPNSGFLLAGTWSVPLSGTRGSNGRKTSPAMPRRNKSRILRRSDQTELSETRNPLKDQLGTPGIETGAGTRTGQSRRQKGWQCPRGQTFLTSPSQGRSLSMF
ncbi:hypothetical protein F2Q69_00013406 [Brassica cretica]|uniref:Uncharacterized protein n=1 Tax=Brassica cretica TaxID=69181 RepID=A0A8S9QT52_BRACR|nr:hypothetical protein F2Q69_00013406 [Brassica cretica]